MEEINQGVLVRRQHATDGSLCWFQVSVDSMVARRTPVFAAVSAGVITSWLRNKPLDIYRPGDNSCQHRKPRVNFPLGLGQHLASKPRLLNSIVL